MPALPLAAAGLLAVRLAWLACRRTRSSSVVAPQGWMSWALSITSSAYRPDRSEPRLEELAPRRGAFWRRSGQSRLPDADRDWFPGLPRHGPHHRRSRQVEAT